MRWGIILASVVLLAALLPYAIASAVEIDAVAELEYVVDGDTVRARIVEVCDPGLRNSIAGFEGRIRFADINAPELSTPEGVEAKKALQALLAGVNTLLLDVDDMYVFDRYGRIVAVVYIEVNETTMLNVNMWLLEKGYAEPRDYPNEFHPGSWSLLAPKPQACGVGESGAAEEAEPVTLTVTKTVTVTVSRETGGRQAVETVTVTRTVTQTVTATATLVHTVTVAREAPAEAITETVTKTVTVSETVRLVSLVGLALLIIIVVLLLVALIVWLARRG